MSSDNRRVLQLYFQKHEIGVLYDNDMDGYKKILKIPDIMAEGKVISYGLEVFQEETEVKFKAVVFILAEDPLEYQDFQYGCQQFCKKNGYFCYFISLAELPYNAALMDAKFMVPEGEKVAVCYINGEIMLIQIYIRGKKFYHFQTLKMLTSPKKFTIFKPFLKAIVNNIGTKKISCITKIPSHDSKSFEEKKLANWVKKALAPDYEVFVCEKPWSEMSYDASYAKCLDAMGELENPFLVEPMLMAEFSVTHGNVFVIKESCRVALPYEKSITLLIKSKNEFITLNEDNKLVETFKLDKFVNKEVKVTLKIDENRFYDLSVKSIGEEEELEKLYKKMMNIIPLKSKQQITQQLLSKENIVSNAPINNKNLTKSAEKTLTISSIPKAKIILCEEKFYIKIIENGETRVLPSKNGQNFTSLLINFSNNKPCVGGTSSDKNQPLVVYDLIKLCSITDPTKADPSWPFTLKKTEKNGLMVEFDTFEGKKAATPAFLMALIFRDFLSQIKKETGIKITKLEIEFNDIQLSENIFETIKNSAKLVNIEFDNV